MFIRKCIFTSLRMWLTFLWAFTIDTHRNIPTIIISSNYQFKAAHSLSVLTGVLNLYERIRQDWCDGCWGDSLRWLRGGESWGGDWGAAWGAALSFLPLLPLYRSPSKGMTRHATKIHVMESTEIKMQHNIYTYENQMKSGEKQQSIIYDGEKKNENQLDGDDGSGWKSHKETEESDNSGKERMRDEWKGVCGKPQSPSGHTIHCNPL